MIDISALPSGVEQRISRALSGLVGEPKTGPLDLRVPVPYDPRLPPWLLRFVLEHVVGGHQRDMGEKTAWCVGVRHHGIAMSVAHQKFGIRFYLSKAEIERFGTSPEEAVTGVLRAVADSRRLVEQHLLRPIVEEQLRAGRVTIESRFYELRERYAHFRQRSDDTLASIATAADPPPEVEEIDTEFFKGTVTTRRSIRYELRQQGAYDASAAVAAWFSWLEHLLIYSLVLQGFEPGTDDLERLLMKKWHQKLKLVCDLRDPDTKRHYDDLRALAEEQRNPDSHGGIDRSLSLFYPHIPNVGAIPAQLTETNGQPRVRVDPATAEPVPSAWTTLDEAEAWIQQGPLRFAYMMGEYGIDPQFDPAFVRRFREAAAQGDQPFERLVGAHSRWQDDMANMDF